MKPGFHYENLEVGPGMILEKSVSTAPGIHIFCLPLIFPHYMIASQKIYVLISSV